MITYGKEVWDPLPRGEQRCLRWADQIWAISRYSRDRACQANGVDPARVWMVPCAVDGTRFTPAPPDPALVATYGLGDGKVLMTVARLWSGDIYKGVDVTIRALPTIAAAVPEVKYLVIGRGDDQPRLAALAKDLGVGDRVVFAGYVPTAALGAHYRLADAYVMPSQEGFGIVYLEALACGIPVLAGDQDGSADPLQDGRAGRCPTTMSRPWRGPVWRCCLDAMPQSGGVAAARDPSRLWSQRPSRLPTPSPGGRSDRLRAWLNFAQTRRYNRLLGQWCDPISPSLLRGESPPVNQNSFNQIRVNVPGLGCWLTLLGLVWLLGAVGLGWLVKSLAALVLLVLAAPVLAFLGLRFWLRRNLVQGPCPVCDTPLTGLKGTETRCLNCGTVLQTEVDGFARVAEAGTIDITAVEVTVEAKPILPEGD